MVKSVYIHIPFCPNICSYCSFCKIFYNEKYINEYLNSLEEEIKLNYRGELIETIYIGGGTPSCLKLNHLERLLKIIKHFKLAKDFEYTIESNIEDIDILKLNLYKKYKINRISVGIQTFNENHLNLLKRKLVKNIKSKIKLIKDIGIENISVDLIYALPKQTIKDLLIDLEKIIELDIKHISTYSLIIEPNTLLYIKNYKNVSEELDFKMFEIVKNKLLQNDFIHYEISNFCKQGFESKHNLTYWNNEKYYGFGMGASGYLNNVRYVNAKNINDYIKKIYKKDIEYLSFNDKISYEFILGLRKTDGINKEKFLEKYKKDIYSFEIVSKLIKEKKLIDNGFNIFVNPKYMYVLNEILLDFIK